MLFAGTIGIELITSFSCYLDRGVWQGGWSPWDGVPTLPHTHGHPSSSAVGKIRGKSRELFRFLSPTNKNKIQKQK